MLTLQPFLTHPSDRVDLCLCLPFCPNRVLHGFRPELVARLGAGDRSALSLRGL